MGVYSRMWADRTQVERVEAYTRWSFYALIWWMNLSIVGTVITRLGEHPVLTGLVVLGVLLSATSMPVLARVLDDYPEAGLTSPRLRAPLIALGIVGAGGLALALVAPDTGSRSAVIALLLTTGGWTIGGLNERWPRYALPALLIGVGALLLGAGIGRIAFFVLLYAFFVFTIRTSLWLLGVVRELDVARNAQSDLAVAEERLRFSRDVHDVLGRHLSTIAVRAELAAALAERRDPAAPEAMLAVRALANDALREARALARGYRPVELDTEVDGARSLLSAAGIDVRTDLRAVPDRWREPVGWVLREAVTNVLRHASPTAVRIEWRESRDGGVLRIVNDGAPSTDGGPGGPGGSGLHGLRERLEPLGARLETRRDGVEFAVQMTVPADRAESTRETQA